eukprot:scaffold107305_cov63-Phaeocystis_antarctica.AAC.2
MRRRVSLHCRNDLRRRRQLHVGVVVYHVAHRQLRDISQGGTARDVVGRVPMPLPFPVHIGQHHLHIGHPHRTQAGLEVVLARRLRLAKHRLNKVGPQQLLDGLAQLVQVEEVGLHVRLKLPLQLQARLAGKVLGAVVVQVTRGVESGRPDQPAQRRRLEVLLIGRAGEELLSQGVPEGRLLHARGRRLEHKPVPFEVARPLRTLLPEDALHELRDPRREPGDRVALQDQQRHVWRRVPVLLHLLPLAGLQAG